MIADELKGEQMRPLSIVNFERFYLVAILLSLVTTFLSWNDTVANVQATPGVDLGQSFVVGVTVGGLIIQLLLWYFIARKPRAWGKWIFVILFALNLLLTLVSFASGAVLPTIILALTLASLALRAAATWMLFRPDSRRWFGQDGRLEGDVIH